MRIAVYGAGGVGGYLGGRLAQSGEDVVLIARGEHLQAIQKHGLKVESVKGDFVSNPTLATENPNEVGVVDAVILGVKAWQVTEAAGAMRPLIGPETFVVPVQNGVETPSQLVAVLGAHHVLGGSCGINSFIARPDHIKHVLGGRMAIGELDGRSSERTEWLQSALVQAGVKADIVTNVDTSLWTKFLIMAPCSGLGAVTRAPIGVWRSVPETRQIAEQLMEEVVAVAQARDIVLPEGAVRTAIDSLDRLPPNATASMQRDIMEGRPSELEYQNGAVVRMGQENSVDTPVNALIYNCLLPQELKARGQAEFPS